VKLKFDGSSGRKPQTEARRYVYDVIVQMLDAQLTHEPERTEGWVFGGITNEFDRRRVTKAIKAVQVEMRRKARL